MSTITSFSDLNVGFLKQNNAIAPRTGSFYIDVSNNLAEGFGVYTDAVQPASRQDTDTKHEYYLYTTGMPGVGDREIMAVQVISDDLFNGYAIGMNFYNDAILGLIISMFISQINAFGPTALPFTTENDITLLIPDTGVLVGGWCKVIIECIRNNASYPTLALYDKNGNLITKQIIGSTIPNNNGKVGIYMYNTSAQDIGIDDWKTWSI